MKLILVIDDDLDVLVQFELQLGQLGHRVMTCDSPERGLELARTGNPDLVILDVLMPRMDGVEVLRRLRQDEVTRTTPVIIITGESNRERVMDAMNEGTSDYLLKPYTKEQLEEKLNASFAWNIIGRIRTEEDVPLTVERKQGRIVVSFLDNLTAPDLRRALGLTLTSAFQDGLGDDVVVFDLRMIPGMHPAEIPILLDAVDHLDGRIPVHLVAGRNFGALLAAGVAIGRLSLHLSFGDLELGLVQRASVEQ